MKHPASRHSLWLLFRLWWQWSVLLLPWLLLQLLRTWYVYIVVVAVAVAADVVDDSAVKCVHAVAAVVL